MPQRWKNRATARMAASSHGAHAGERRPGGARPTSSATRQCSRPAALTECLLVGSPAAGTTAGMCERAYNRGRDPARAGELIKEVLGLLDLVDADFGTRMLLGGAHLVD